MQDWAVLTASGYVIKIHYGYSPPWVVEGLTVKPVSEVESEKIDLYYKDWNK